MTLQNLHRKLGELLAAGHGRRRVCIDKRTFSAPLEADGGTIVPLHSAEVAEVRRLDGDGFGIYNRDGSERVRQELVLRGDLYEKERP